MKFLVYFYTLFFTVVSFSSHAQLTVDGYTNYTLGGFNVLVENDALTTDPALTNTAINLLESKLVEISQLKMDQIKIDSIQAVPIFMDWNTTSGAAQYHPSKAWLIANGYIPEKARCVEISNVTNFINWTQQNQPYMVLHELAHAYHHRVLNNSHPGITNAYNNAISNNLYTNVLYHAGGGNYFTQASAYARTNEKEFFAELTEAYFGLNDYFPFDQNDLRNYDTVGFNTMISVWGDNALSLPSSAIRTVKLYPNPTSRSIFLSGLNSTIHYIVYDILGNNISKGIIGMDGKINVQYYATGIYFLTLENGTIFKFIKI